MKNPWVFFLIPFINFGCEIINPSDPIPSYISIDQVVIDSFRSQPNSTAIFDVWVTVGGEFVGAYEIERDASKDPLVFPVLKSGNNLEVEVFAGIYRDFTFGKHEPYPFYEVFKTNVPLVEKEVTTIQPNFSYKEEGNGVEFPVVSFENFESQSFRRYIICQLCEIPIQEIDPAILRGGPNQGLGAAYFSLEADDSRNFGMVQRTAGKLPAPPTQVYFEMDYNSNIRIFVDLFANDINNTTTIVLPPTEGEYLKVYLFLTDDIGFLSQFLPADPDFQIFIYSNRNNQEKASDSYASFDNLRIAHP